MSILERDDEVLSRLALAGDASAGVLPTALKVLLGAAVAVALLGAEVRRQDRTGFGLLRASGASRFAICPAALRRYAWEAMGLAVCTAFVATLRSRLGLFAPPSDHSGAVTMEQAWVAITGSWTALVASDWLLSAQASLRVAVYASAALRGPEGNRPLAGGSCALLLAAQLCRVAVLAGSSTHAAGGSLLFCLEVVCLLLLLRLGLQPALSRPIAFLAPCGLCVAFGTIHRLQLAENVLMDSLFSAAHALQLLAAFAHLASTLWSSGGHERIGIGDVTVHMALPLQQGLAAYYYLEVFEASSRVADFGYPVELLWASSVAQLGTYLAASALHFAECCDGDATRSC